MKRTNMKKGITLIEIVLAIIIIAIIAGITIPKLMSQSDRAEMKQVITSDIKSIVDAAVMWKKSSSASSGNFQAVSTDNIESRLPSNMAVDAGKGLIYSAGFPTGTTDTLGGGAANAGTGIVYTISWQFDSTRTATGRFSIAMDIQNGTTQLDWDEKLQAYATEVFEDTINEMSDRDYNQWATDITTTGTGGITFECSDSAKTICLGNIRVN